MRKFSFVFSGLLALGVLFALQQTNSLKSARYTWESPRVPPGFDGFQVALVSDLHGKRFGREQKRLVQAVRDLQPDMIALTGDFIDRKTKDLDFAREFLEGIKNIAPVYWVDGNHDPHSPLYGELHALLAEYGVAVLAGNCVDITHGGDTMRLLGYAFWELYHPIEPADIVLFHGPDDFFRFAALGCGLVLSGHNHGGQIALPGGRAVLAPNWHLFPKYSGGVYAEGESTMVLSRGLGTSDIHVRLFARPEVVGVVFRAG
ncbi:MAG: metallophosphoesterase [Oscillospiraceae bacterium]|nr:metallophosphoesterase [Oscillospiraceae bacterium]